MERRRPTSRSPAGAASQPTRKPASNASPAPVVSAGVDAAASRRRTRARPPRVRAPGPSRPRGPRLTTASGAIVEQAAEVAPAEQRLRLDARSRTGRPARRRGRGRSAARRPSARSGPTDGEVEADTSAPAARARARSARRPASTERLAEQRVRRQVEEVDAEPVGCRSAGAQRDRRPRRSATKRALAARRHEDADPAGPLPGDAGRADADAVASRARRRAPAPRRRGRPRRRASIGRRAARASGPSSPRSRPGAARRGPARRCPISSGRRRREHDVEHQVAEDDDARRARRRDAASGTRQARRGMGSGHGREDSGASRLQWPDRTGAPGAPTGAAGARPR